jgi:flavin reductase (DIM6/NTAB) family NADH-FMN oxidoreductase RutF
MFYDTVSYAHGLPHDPIKAIIAPRPIGWISAMSSDGAVNLSPYSFFNAFSTRPTIVGFGSEGMKDAVSFIAQTREFVCNLATYDLRDQMNMTSAPLARGTSEFEHAGLEREASQLVKPPRVKGVAAALECRLVDILRLKTSDGDELDGHLVLGHVVGVYIDDRFIKNGLFDTAAARPIARCGYRDYAVVDELFSMTRPAGG